MDPSGLPQMRALVELEGSGLVALRVADQYGDLGRMYQLFRRADGGLDLLRSVMGAHLKEQGRQLVQARAVPRSVRTHRAASGGSRWS